MTTTVDSLNMLELIDKLKLIQTIQNKLFYFFNCSRFFQLGGAI